MYNSDFGSILRSLSLSSISRECKTLATAYIMLSVLGFEIVEPINIEFIVEYLRNSSESSIYFKAITS